MCHKTPTNSEQGLYTSFVKQLYDKFLTRVIRKGIYKNSMTQVIKETTFVVSFPNKIFIVIEMTQRPTN